MKGGRNMTISENGILTYRYGEVLDAWFPKGIFGTEKDTVLNTEMSGLPVDIGKIAGIYRIAIRDTIRPRGDYLIEDRIAYVNPIGSDKDARMAEALAIAHHLLNPEKQVLSGAENDAEYACAICLLTPEMLLLPGVKAVAGRILENDETARDDFLHVFDEKNKAGISVMSDMMNVPEDAIMTRLVSFGFYITCNDL